MYLTDHRHSVSQLREFGEQIRAGRFPAIPAQVAESFRTLAREYSQMLGIPKEDEKLPSQLTFKVGEDRHTAEYVAKQIHLLWVEGNSREDFAKLQEKLPFKHHKSFADRCRLYCEATALLVVLEFREKDERYEELLTELERTIFPPKMNKEAVEKLALIKEAIVDLDHLLSDSKELTWAMEWFHKMGCDQVSPPRLTFLSATLKMNASSLIKMLTDFGPPTA